MPKCDELTSREANWSSLRVGVLGLGVAGFAAADALMQLGADVSIVDSAATDPVNERAEILGSLGAHTFIGAAELPSEHFRFGGDIPGIAAGPCFPPSGGTGQCPHLGRA